MNWVFAELNMRGTGSALARSWLDWGQPLSQPRYGCVAVLTRGTSDGWQGHVGFFLRADAQYIYLLGGNQLEAVCENTYPIESLLGYRWPASVAL